MASDPGQRRVLAGGRRGPAQLPAQGRLPLGRRFLGAVGVGGVHRARSPRRCRPASIPVKEITAEHPIYRMLFPIAKIPQVPSMQFWRSSGGATSEMDEYSANAHMAAILDKQGRIMVLMTHNTDIADSWEREGDDPEFFFNFSPNGYAVGLNAVALCDDATESGSGLSDRSAAVLDRRDPAGGAPSRRRRSSGIGFRGGGGTQPLSAALSDGDQLRRRLQLLPPDVHQRSPRSRAARAGPPTTGTPTSTSRSASAS